MANIQIPNLPAAVALSGSEQVEAVQGGVSVRVTTADIAALGGGGGPVGGFTPGSVIFADGAGELSQDNANLFWDDTNNRLGVGTDTPSVGLDVVGDMAASGDGAIGGQLGVGNSSPAYTLDVTGNFYASDNSAIGGLFTDYGPTWANLTVGGDSKNGDFDVKYSNGVAGIYMYVDTPSAPTEGIAWIDSYASDDATLRFRIGHDGSASSQGLQFIVAGSDPITFTANGSERMRLTSAGRLGVGTNAPSAVLDVASDVMRLRTSKTPASATDPGNAGDICWDSNYVYVCVATNTWKRATLASW